jgi:probable rRNA maturation factor
MCDTGDNRSAEAQEMAGADSEPPERLQVEIFRHGGDWSPFEPIEPSIVAASRALADTIALSAPVAEVAIALSSDGHVQTLNRTYRGNDKSTNVLSFPAAAMSGGGDGMPPFLGDIVLAAETVAREAAEQDRPPRHHLQHLVVHGLLHLLGYDHQSADEAEEMEALEVEILARLGIANPYAEPVSAAS